MKTTGMKKNDSGMNVYLRLGTYLWKYKAYAITAIILVVASNFISLLGPTLSGKAIDAIRYDVQTRSANVDFRSVFINCGLMIGVYVASSVISFVLSNILIRYSQKISFQLRKEIFDKLMELPVGYFDQLQAGDIISRISYDVDNINASLAHDLLQIFNSILTILGALYYMIMISPKMLLIFLITLPFSIAYTIWKSKKVRPLFRKRSAALGSLNGFTEEMLSGVKTIKAYGREKQFLGRYNEKNTEANEAYYQACYQSASLGPSVNLINNVSIAIISITGASFFVKGYLSLGNISSFISYGKRFSNPINEFSNIISDLQSCRSAAERVFTIIDEYTEFENDHPTEKLGDINGKIEFSHVKFRYNPDREIIHDLNVTANAGQTVAIVGPTGGGKTTIVNLLMRFYDIQHGKIMIDGVPIDNYDRKELRSVFTMVLQETWLFNGTVAENISYGADNATREDIERVAKAAGIHDFVMSLPEGYDTYLKDGGLNISKGQKQLITIARAMLSKAKILILDEATSNIDTRTEIQIEKAMLKLMEGKTCFVIAHRLSTIRDADVIMVVRSGDVVEIGTHKELLDKGGFYSELYFSQYN